MSHKKVLGGAAVLGAAGIVVKLFGFLFRVVLANIIGAEGIAYYQASYPIYQFFLILATAGLPVAISKMVSENVVIGDYRSASDILKLSIKLMLGIGFAGFVIFFFFAQNFSEFINMPKAAFAMKLLAPALIVVPVMAAFRGFYQGRQNMRPTALSQVVEQFFRMIAGTILALIFYLSSSGHFGVSNIEAAVGGATFGATAGAIIGMLLMIYITYLMKGRFAYEKSRSKVYNKRESSVILKRILVIAIPITIGAAISPILDATDVFIVVKRLTGIGFSKDVAATMYGRYSGLAMPLMNAPTVFIQAIVMSLVPTISAAYKLRNRKELNISTNLGLKLAMIIAAPCSAGMLALSKPVLMLAYPGRLQDAIAAAPILAIMSLGVFFLAMILTLSAVLQGIEKQFHPVRNILIGIVAKIILTYVLTSIPSINVVGAAIGTVCAYGIAMLLNFNDVKRFARVRYDVKGSLVRPVIAAFIMVVLALALHKGLFAITSRMQISTLITCVISAVVYLKALFVVKAINVRELLDIPKGDKLVKLLVKLRMVTLDKNIAPRRREEV